jgi:Zn-dependent protease with chaperone function
MDYPIIVRYRWSVEDLIQAYRYYFRHICRPVIRFALHFIFAIMTMGGVLALLHYCGILHYAKHHEVSPVMTFGFIVVGLYWFVFRRFDFRWTVRRRYAKRPDKDSEIEWQIAADKVSVRSCIAYSEFRWEAFIKVVRAPSGLMLYGLDQLFCYYLPRRGFVSDAEFEQAVELAKSKVPRFYRVT